jgi:hypothetical protein
MKTYMTLAVYTTVACFFLFSNVVKAQKPIKLKMISKFNLNYPKAGE